MISLTLVYCLVLNPTMCRELPVGHEDYQPITSISDCMIGGAIGTASFRFEQSDWFVKGFKCVETPETHTVFKDWMEHQTVLHLDSEPADR